METRDLAVPEQIEVCTRYLNELWEKTPRKRVSSYLIKHEVERLYASYIDADSLVTAAKALGFETKPVENKVFIYMVKTKKMGF